MLDPSRVQNSVAAKTNCMREIRSIVMPSGGPGYPGSPSPPGYPCVLLLLHLHVLPMSFQGGDSDVAKGQRRLADGEHGESAVLH